MTFKEIKRQLKEVYRERKKWNGAKGPFTAEAIFQRGLILMKQYTLYNLENAKMKKDKNKVAFNCEILKVINEYY